MLWQVYDSPLGSLPNSVIDLSTVAKPGHYRLIDCARFIQRRHLSIYEFDGPISNVSYAAISYVWRGNKFDPAAAQVDPGAFSVRGAEDGDPIGLDLIHHTCIAAVRAGAQYLWLDRLCIMQTDKTDKNWQIARMYDIYLQCKVCLVLPGGIRQLVALEDETTWITRAWTLQEVTAPRCVSVLFRWEKGSGSWQGYNDGVKGSITEIVPNKSAMAGLREVVDACCHPEALYWTPTDGSQPSSDDLSVSIVGNSSAISDMLTESLCRVLDADPDSPEGALAIWQNAFWRASSRPVDMVLSIMGIFQVSLNPGSFHKDDRAGATIALAREILRRGGKPTWLVMAFDVPPCPFLSYFPEFPKTDVAGMVDLETATDEQQFDLTLWYVTDLPDGSMDDDGYLTVVTKATPVIYTGNNVQEVNFASRQNDNLNSDCAVRIRVVARDGKTWDILRSNDTRSKGKSRSFIAFLGHAQDYDRAESSATNMGPYTLPRLTTLRAIILEEHEPGRFHKAGALTLGEAFEPIILNEWQEHDFAIGGPNPLPIGTFLREARSLDKE